MKYMLFSFKRFKEVRDKIKEKNCSFKNGF